MPPSLLVAVSALPGSATKAFAQSLLEGPASGGVDGPTPSMNVVNLCSKIPRKRHGVSAQHCMLVGLGQPAEVQHKRLKELRRHS